jgi:hypothetical protein
MGKRKAKRSREEQLEMIAFEYYEALRYVLRDMAAIDALIPRESSRASLSRMEPEAAAIIQARKIDLLGYIQTICRDHMYFGQKLLASGWEPEHKGKFGQKVSYLKWDYGH